MEQSLSAPFNRREKESITTTQCKNMSTLEVHMNPELLGMNISGKAIFRKYRALLRNTAIQCGMSLRCLSWKLVLLDMLDESKMATSSAKWVYVSPCPQEVRFHPFQIGKDVSAQLKTTSPLFLEC